MELELGTKLIQRAFWLKDLVKQLGYERKCIRSKYLCIQNKIEKSVTYEGSVASIYLGFLLLSKVIYSSFFVEKILQKSPNLKIHNIFFKKR